MTREEVIRGLECCKQGADYTDPICSECPYSDEYAADCVPMLAADALALLKGTFTPQEVYDTVVEHAQHDMRFKLGDKIDYSFTDVVDILNIELMCKAGDM